MKWLILLLWCPLSFAAEVDAVGEVTRISGPGATLTRAGATSELKEGEDLFIKDTVRTEKGMVQLLLNPGTQVNLGQNSALELNEQSIEVQDDQTTVKSVIHFLQGHLRLLVDKLGTTVDQRVERNGVAFAVRGTEFEVEDGDDGMDLQVFEGQVEVLDQQESLGTVSKEESVTVPKVRGSGRRQWIKRGFKRRERGLAFAQSGQLREKWERRRLRWLNRRGLRVNKRLERRGLRVKRR